MLNQGQDIANVLPTVAAYGAPFVNLHLMSGLFTYKSLAFYVVGSPTIKIIF